MGEGKGTEEQEKGEREINIGSEALAETKKTAFFMLLLLLLHYC